MNIVTHTCGFQFDSLEQDAFEVLRLVMSMKNSLAPINKLPPEVLSHIPDYYCADRTDRDLIASTHVCRRWRDTFISSSSLWTRFDFTCVDKTRTYIERSRSSSLKFRFMGFKVTDEAFTLVAPHIRRLKSLTIDVSVPKSFLRNFHSVPLLEKLDINWRFDKALDNEPSNGDLSSLRELRLCGVVTHFPWINLSNLRIVDLKLHRHSYGTTEILDFFVSSPLLHTVSLRYSIPVSSDASPERIVPLHCLKDLTVVTTSSPSILLHHLHIPTGASVILEFPSNGAESPFPDYLPKSCPNSDHISNITAINLLFNSTGTSLRLSGPSGNLRLLNSRRYDPPEAGQILRSLCPVISTTDRLAIFGYNRRGPVGVKYCPIFRALSSANNLRTLILADCTFSRFTRVLDPSQILFNLLLCPNMENLILYAKSWSLPSVISLISMAKNRASRGAKLSSITIVGLDDPAPREVLELKEHVTHVEDRVDDGWRAWDDVPGDGW